MHVKLTGEANDYVGKGMAGGEIVIVNPPDINYRPEDSSLVGNTCLYGATGGRLFVNGRAGAYADLSFCPLHVQCWSLIANVVSPQAHGEVIRCLFMVAWLNILQRIWSWYVLHLKYSLPSCLAAGPAAVAVGVGNAFCGSRQQNHMCYQK